MSLFERYLTLWVIACIAAGILLGSVMPGLFAAIAGAELYNVNLPVAVLVWLMIIPMLMKIDFAALRQVGSTLARHRHYASAQLGDKALYDGGARLAVHRLAVPPVAA